MQKEQASSRPDANFSKVIDCIPVNPLPFYISESDSVLQQRGEMQNSQQVHKRAVFCTVDPQSSAIIIVWKQNKNTPGASELQI